MYFHPNPIHGNVQPSTVIPAWLWHLKGVPHLKIVNGIWCINKLGFVFRVSNHTFEMFVLREGILYYIPLFYLTFHTNNTKH